jgi:uncharacterized protein YkwD
MRGGGGLLVRDPEKGPDKMGALKRFAAATLVATLAVLTVAIAPAHASASTDEAKFVSDINRERSSRGIGTLTVKSDLVSVARQHSADMASKGTIWHASGTPYKVSGWTVYGENVGMGGNEPDLHVAFMNSPEHRENILDRAFNQIGVGVVYKDGVLYVTEIFVKRASSTSTSTTKPKTTYYKPVATTTSRSTTTSRPSAPARKPAAKPAARKPAPTAAPRTVSVLVQLVGLDAASVNPATGEALGV